MPSPLPSVNGLNSGRPLAFAGQYTCESPDHDAGVVAPNRHLPHPQANGKERPEMWPQCGARPHYHVSAWLAWVQSCCSREKRYFSAICVDTDPTRRLYNANTAHRPRDGAMARLRSSSLLEARPLPITVGGSWLRRPRFSGGWDYLRPGLFDR